MAAICASLICCADAAELHATREPAITNVANFMRTLLEQPWLGCKHHFACPAYLMTRRSVVFPGREITEGTEFTTEERRKRRRTKIRCSDPSCRCNESQTRPGHLFVCSSPLL